MIRKLIKYFFLIRNRQRITPIPRMLASDYTRLTDDEARVMTRYGIRSPSGLKVAMKKHKVKTLDELVAQLEHYRPKRRLGDKFRSMLIRISGGVPYHPHQKQIRQLFKKTPNSEVLKARIRMWK